MNKHWWQSGAIKGALVVAGAIITSPEVLNVVPEKYAAILAALGFVYNQVSQRHAIAKNGAGL